MNYAIETRELSFSFRNGFPVVDRLSLQVPMGSIYGFLGPNGAGKTTTIRMLTGMLLSDRDNIFINGASLQKSIPQVFEKIGALIENPSLYLHLTAIENLRMITTLRGLPKARMDAVLEIVGLTGAARRKVKEFSLGMKQRLGIAMALLPDPSLLILDEPANGLDPSGIIEIRELLKRLNSEGKTIFVSSHLLAEIEKTCTHIGVIHKGSLRYQDTLEAMQQTASASGEVVFRIPAAAERLVNLQGHHPDCRQVGTDEVLFPFAKREDVALLNQQLVGAGVPVEGIQVRGGLEDWFMRLTQKN
ncbi:MAG: transporter ATP-binding protein [Flaviaesturariibacter sp.]|nr:transporter ATP-binding protein [Flaviaesturariibacter sp.]